ILCGFTEKLRGRNAALSIAAVVIILGLPLWWKTTETYRAWLPYSQISELDSLQLQLSVEVEVVFSRGTLSPEQQKKVPLSQTREQEHQIDAKNGLLYKYETKYRTATIMEEDALNQPTARAGSLKDVLSALEPQVRQVIDTMSFSHQEIMGTLSDRIRISQVSKESLVESMRAIKSSPGYEITFSLLNPDPKSHSLHWNIEGAVHNYIQPLLNKLAPIANFSVDSQILYYAMLGVNPRFDSAASAYTLNAASLAHVINPVEARLGSNAASSYPVLNFLLYVPEAHHSPLFIRDHRKKDVPSNAFHSPRWGGIMVRPIFYIIHVCQACLPLVEDGGISEAVVEDGRIGGAVVEDGGIGGAVIEDEGISGAVVEDGGISEAVVEDGRIGGAVVEDGGISEAVVKDEGIGGAVVEDGGIGGAVVEDGGFVGAVVEDGRISEAVVKDEGISGAVVEDGGISGEVVYNVNDMYGPEAEFPVDIDINMTKVMSVFLAQLRQLLGVQKTQAPPGFILQSPGSAGLADWELDQLMWSRSVENVATATTTITSLAQLLDQISNIVINDNIAQQVSSAVSSLQAATAELEAGNLAFALQYSREAILASEKAFFDPSLLHLLYFPDDQKFAIYIPLFLPMCVPIVLSLLKIINEFRQKRAEKLAKKD
ncbi:GPI transamidase component PIG-S, partial [Silurus meridionalis]